MEKIVKIKEINHRYGKTYDLSFDDYVLEYECPSSKRIMFDVGDEVTVNLIKKLNKIVVASAIKVASRRRQFKNPDLINEMINSQIEFDSYI
jgi:hypothetical protein